MVEKYSSLYQTINNPNLIIRNKQLKLNFHLGVKYSTSGISLHGNIEVGAKTLKSGFTYLKPFFLELYLFFGENGPRKRQKKHTYKLNNIYKVEFLKTTV